MLISQVAPLHERLAALGFDVVNVALRRDGRFSVKLGATEPPSRLAEAQAFADAWAPAPAPTLEEALALDGDRVLPLTAEQQAVVNAVLDKARTAARARLGWR